MRWLGPVAYWVTLIVAAACVLPGFFYGRATYSVGTYLQNTNTYDLPYLYGLYSPPVSIQSLAVAQTFGTGVTP
jgi:hypothetical protein